jgi:8-oxo-dGTP pyrophosphatase MutT (NUDIX family)
MTVEVALAMLERQGRWLLQLRDDIEGIVYPGTWALFGGHLEAAESPEVALRRELLEEINWQASHLNFWFDHRDPHRTAYFFRSQLDVPLAEGNPQRQGLEPKVWRKQTPGPIPKTGGAGP